VNLRDRVIGQSALKLLPGEVVLGAFKAQTPEAFRLPDDLFVIFDDRRRTGQRVVVTVVPGRTADCGEAR
jgi:hypothetical protein